MAQTCAPQGAPCLQQTRTIFQLVQVGGHSVQMAMARCCAVLGHTPAAPVCVQQGGTAEGCTLCTAFLTEDAIADNALVALQGLGTDTACRADLYPVEAIP